MGELSNEVYVDTKEFMGSMDAMDIRLNEKFEIVPLDKLEEAREEYKKSVVERHKKIVEDIIKKGKYRVLVEIEGALRDIVEKGVDHSYVEVVDYNGIKGEYCINFTSGDLVDLVKTGTLKVSKISLLENLVLEKVAKERNIRVGDETIMYFGDILGQYAEKVIKENGYKFTKFVVPELEIYNYYIYTGEEKTKRLCKIKGFMRAVPKFIKMGLIGIALIGIVMVLVDSVLKMAYTAPPM